MFAMPGESPVQITPAAEARIGDLMSSKQAFGLRIGLKKGGCAGMEYTMALAENAEPHDEIVEQGAARLLIAPNAQMFLFGTRVDFVEDALESGFRFVNPNVVEACGCGESVRFEALEGSKARPSSDAIPDLKG